MSQDEIDARLRALPLVPTLVELFLGVQIADHATVWSPVRETRQRALALILLPPADAERFCRLDAQPAGPLVMSSHGLLALARRRIAVFDDAQDRGDVDASIRLPDLMDLVLATNDSAELSQPPTRDPYVNVVHELRFRMYFSRAQPRYWYELAYHVFFEHFAATDFGEDVLARFEANVGLPLIDCWYFGTLLGWQSFSLPDSIASALGSTPDDVREASEWARVYVALLASPSFAEVMRHEVNDRTGKLDRWLELCSATELDVFRAARQDDANKKFWGFSAFYNRPILQFHVTPGLVSRPRYLQERSAPEGLFWLLSEHAELSEKEQADLHQTYGDAFEKFGRSGIASVLRPDEAMWSEHDLKEQWPMKKGDKVCDVVLSSNALEVAAGFDFKKHFFTRDFRATGTVDGAAQLLKELIKAKLARGLDQVVDTVRRMRGSPQLDERPVLPVVVLGSLCPASPVLGDLVEAELIESGIDLAGTCRAATLPGRGFVVMDAFEFTLLLACARSGSESFLTLLLRWQREMPYNTLFDWTAYHQMFPVPDDDIWFRRLTARHGRPL